LQAGRKRREGRKVNYVTRVAEGPPRLVLWGNNANGVHFGYRRFLVNRFRTHWDFEGTPIKLHVRERTRRSEVPEELAGKVHEADLAAEADELQELSSLDITDIDYENEEGHVPEDAVERDQWKAPDVVEGDWVSSTWEDLDKE